MSHRTIIFAKNLMTLRTLHEMTQQELADKIHVTRQTTISMVCCPLNT